MAFTLLQSNSNFVGASSTVTVSLANSTAGSTILFYMGAAGVNTSFTIGDGVNGPYSQDVSTSGVHTVVVGHLSNNIGGALNIQGTMAAGPGPSLRLAVEEWTGIGVSPFDTGAAASNAAGSTSLSSGASGTLKQSGELVVCYGFTTSGSLTWTAGGSFTLDPNLVPVNAGKAVEFLTAAGTAAQTGTFTVSSASPWVCMLATYQPGSINTPIINMGQACL